MKRLVAALALAACTPSPAPGPSAHVNVESPELIALHVDGAWYQPPCDVPVGSYAVYAGPERDRFVTLVDIPLEATTIRCAHAPEGTQPSPGLLPSSVPAVTCTARPTASRPWQR